mmetsp:Transcript_41876/g.65440  ORF Transcript_41876/g.65440 Transcript_41876/m.65440 type:complete len:90 (-) Transcript_41876:963-1232(-)
MTTPRGPTTGALPEGTTWAMIAGEEGEVEMIVGVIAGAAMTAGVVIAGEAAVVGDAGKLQFQRLPLARCRSHLEPQYPNHTPHSIRANK